MNRASPYYLQREIQLSSLFYNFESCHNAICGKRLRHLSFHSGDVLALQLTDLLTKNCAIQTLPELTLATVYTNNKNKHFSYKLFKFAGRDRWHLQLMSYKKILDISSVELFFPILHILNDRLLFKMNSLLPPKLSCHLVWTLKETLGKSQYEHLSPAYIVW